MVATLDLLGWNRVTILNTDTAYAKDMTTAFQGLWKGEIAYLATVKIRPDGTVDFDSMDGAFEGIPFGDPTYVHCKVVVLMGHDQHVYDILEHARLFFGEETFYVGPEGWSGRSPQGSTAWMPRNPGYIGVVPHRERGEGSVYRRFVDLGLALEEDSLQSVIDENGDLPDYAADYTVDAIVAMCLTLSRIPYGDRRQNGQLAASILRELDFEGVSGRVRFTPGGDRADPVFSIVNYQAPCSTCGPEWVTVGKTGTNPGSAAWGPGGLGMVCFGGLGCGLSEAPADSDPIPPDAIAVWVPVVLVVLCLVFGVSFGVYRHRKIRDSRRTRAILKAREDELDTFRNSVVDMCVAESQYVPKAAGWRPINGTGSTQGAAGVRWCWRETPSQMYRWKHGDDAERIEGDAADCWIRYDAASNSALELTYHKQGKTGLCVLGRSGYTVDFRTMVQTKDETGFERKVKRVEGGGGDPPSAYDFTDIADPSDAKPYPREIGNEPQMVLVPGDIVQISKKRNDGWAYGSKLHLQDEPLGRRLVQHALGLQDGASSLDFKQYGTNGDDGAMIITDKNGWFPMVVTRVPDTDDLDTLRTTLGGTDDLVAPKHWDKIADPSVVQKSKPLDKHNHEYKKVAAAFLSTLPPTTKIVRIQRIQNIAMWQSYVVKRKTVIDRDQSSTLGSKQAQARFERTWLWHGSNVSFFTRGDQQPVAFCIDWFRQDSNPRFTIPIVCNRTGRLYRKDCPAGIQPVLLRQERDNVRQRGVLRTGCLVQQLEHVLPRQRRRPQAHARL